MKKALSNHVEQLIQNFSFDELNIADQTAVLKEISQEEYISYQYILSQSIGLHSPAAPASIHDALITELGTRAKAQKTFLQSIIDIKIPLWAAATLAFLIFGLYQLSFVNKSIENIKLPIEENVAAPSIVYITDTIYKEIKTEPIVITKEIEKIVYIEKDTSYKQNKIEGRPLATNTSLMTSKNTTEHSANNSLFGDLDISEIAINNQQGRSVAQDKELMNLLDKMEE